MNTKEILMKIIKRKNTENENTKLRREYNRLLDRLSDIRTNFDHTDDPFSIDALIFEENATICRLHELYSIARKNKITLEAFELDQK